MTQQAIMPPIGKPALQHHRAHQTCSIAAGTMIATYPLPIELSQVVAEEQDSNGQVEQHEACCPRVTTK
jgi:hypothetical protein